MSLGRRQFRIAQLRLFGDQLPRLIDIAGHEYAESDLEAFEDALVERRQFGCALGRKLELAPYFLGRDLAHVLVDDVPDMLQVDGEGNNLHGAPALALIEAAARELGDIVGDQTLGLVFPFRLIPYPGEAVVGLTVHSG